MKAKLSITKSYPAESGHKGIPGHRGGSLPGNATGGNTTAKVTVKKPKVYLPYNTQGNDTYTKFRLPDGSWTPERQALHDEIKKKIFAGKTPVSTPVSYVLGGGTASGKSTLLKSGRVTLPENIVTVDADVIKGMLPEYSESLAKNDVSAAAFVHEESSYLAKSIAAEAAANSYNVVLDGTGDNSIASISKKVESLRELGQSVMGIYVTSDVDVAIERSIARAIRTGRYVPESVIRFNHASVSNVFPKIIEKGLFDNLQLYDTSSGEVVLVGSGSRSKFKVIDPAAYARFLSKAISGAEVS